MFRLWIGVFSVLTLLMSSVRAEAAVTLVNRHQSIAVNAGQSKLVSAACSAGEVLVGGGWDASSGKVFTYASFPQTNSQPRWTAIAKNLDSTTQVLYAFAVCASGDANASSYSVTQAVNVSAGNNGWGQPACSNGSVAAGGFFSNTDASTFVPFMSLPMTGSDLNKWRTAFHNFSGSPQSFVAHTLCVQNLDATFDTAAIAGVQVQVGPLQDEPPAYKNCSSGYFVTGSGFWTSDNVPNSWLYGNRATSTTQSVVRTHNGHQYSTMFVRAYAKCIDPW